jgi:uncharacterized membrane protein
MSLRPTGFNNTPYHRDVLTEDEVVSTTEVVDEPTGEVRVGFVDRWLQRLAEIHPAAWFTGAGALLFALVFGKLGVDHHNNFGTWSYDMGIYDQGFWLVSRGGQSFMTVRGMEFWGHHLNLVVLGYVPFYWLGAGPAFLYVSQAVGLAVAAFPVYLIARDRFSKPWMGLLFAVVYLMYAPIQWISWANYHPEALVIAPILYAWWFATQRRWRGMFIALLIALSIREDAALVVIMLGLILLIMYRPGKGEHRDRMIALATIGLGFVWYVIATKFVIPHFNQGKQPFYIQYFYSNYGKDVPAIIETMLRHPNRVVGDATQPDRLRFYRDLALPLGGLPLAGPLALLMAVPQMLASVIGLSPYARSIHYQYTAMMIAPLMIAAIEGAWLLWRFKVMHVILPIWLLGCAYMTNVAWSPSPIGDSYNVWAQPQPRHELMREALKLVPADASVAATYTLLPHLSHRTQIYDWPNPWVPSYWGNDDGYRLPDPSTIQYIVLDMQQVGEAQKPLVATFMDPAGPYQVLFNQDDVVVIKRKDAP